MNRHLILTMLLALAACDSPERAKVPATEQPNAAVDQADGVVFNEVAPMPEPGNLIAAGDTEAAEDDAAWREGKRQEREPDHWYYAAEIGDGPAIVYSRSGGDWDYAFACDSAKHQIEFLVLGADKPPAGAPLILTLASGRLKASPNFIEGGRGALSAIMSASHPFFDALAGSREPLILSLPSGQSVTIQSSPLLGRIVRACREATPTTSG